MKSLTEHLYEKKAFTWDISNCGIHKEGAYLESDIFKAVEAWLTENRQQIKKQYNVEWSEQAIGAYKQIDKLLEELKK